MFIRICCERIPEERARYVYLNQVHGAQNFSPMYMCIELEVLIQALNHKMRVSFPVGMVFVRA